MNVSTAPAGSFWTDEVRCPHGLIEEGDGTFSVFYTARSAADHGWYGVGHLRVLVRYPLLEFLYVPHQPLPLPLRD